MERLSQILKILSENKIDFVIVGGFGAVLHGSSIVTQALDLCVTFSENLIKKLRDCLVAYHPVHRMTPQKLSFMDYPQDLKSLKNLYLNTDLGILDLLSEVSGVGDISVLKKTALEVELFGEKCKVISIQDLIKSKKIMGRPKDIAVLKELDCIFDQSKGEKF